LSKTRSDFCAMVSHELRTPMATVREGLRLVADDLGDGLHNEQKEYLRMTQENVERLIRLANQILDFSSLEANTFKLRLRDIDVNALIRDHATFVDPQIKARGLRIALELAEGLPTVRGDPETIVQVLTNLVSNAIKYTARGEITIRSRPQDAFTPAPGSAVPQGGGSWIVPKTPDRPSIAGKGVLISVVDTGRGIRSDMLQIIFEPFNALWQTEVTTDSGAGLGLAITGRMVAAHGGIIAISSSEGHGTTAHVFLPLNADSGIITEKIGSPSNVRQNSGRLHEDSVGHRG
jgi:signal transduction histidine kinase